MSDLYLQLAEKHGHYCPMSTLGLRLGMEAVRLTSAAGANEWHFYYSARTCAVDGIALALERASDPAELVVEQQGRHLLLCRSADGKELSIALSAEALQLAKEYHDCDDDGKNRQLGRLRSLAAERLFEISGLTTDV